LSLDSSEPERPSRALVLEHAVRLTEVDPRSGVSSGRSRASVLFTGQRDTLTAGFAR